MKDGIVSLLFKVDLTGIVREVFWADPIFLISITGKTFHEVFDYMEGVVPAGTLTGKGRQEGKVITLPGCRLREFGIPIACSAVALREATLVIATDYNTASGGFSTTVHSELIHRFLLQLSRWMDNPPVLNKHQSVDDYQQIQILNNELVNTHRRLEKANAQLNRLNEELHNRLVQDALTGLVSRYQYRSEMEQCIAKNPKALGLFAFIDIDSFKSINDTYGHAIGDAFLVGFADRLKKIDMQLPTICMRIAGDEFGLFIHGLQSVDNQFFDGFWRQFSEVMMGKPILSGTHTLPVSCSMGLSVYGQDTDNIYTLIEYADFAMYQAKNSGKRGYRRFDRDAYAKAHLR
jgi:diguanylate cyclase (GGDEF)-like protein